jgi:type II secretory ATPase GspE/PulE/Tfp pilus assembly ATPase PilB-like protein
MIKLSLSDYDSSNLSGYSQYPPDFIRTNGAVKIREDSDTVVVAVVDGRDQSVYDFLEGFHIPKKTEFLSLSKTDFASFVGNESDSEISNRAAQVIPDSNVNLDSVSKDAPIVNIINSICIDAIERGASDIHIEAQKESTRVRFRIDGALHTVKTMPLGLFATIASRIKVMANLNILEQRLPQDGRMTVTIGSRDIDMRVSTVPVSRGESIVLRIFNRESGLLSLDELGFSGGNLEAIRLALRHPNGLILVTGPTGSGKTTTLHAVLGMLNDDYRKIIAIEDPVEQILGGVSQIQINETIGLGFDSTLRRVLRQDPDVIMVGEIRDSTTAELALRSSLTGHLILSTLHTNDSVSVISRLRNMGLEPYLIAAVLRCSIAQRLVRKVCPACSEDVPLDERTRSLRGLYGLQGETMKKPHGCKACGGTGFSGRTVIGEVLTIDGEIEDMIVNNCGDRAIAETAEKKGMGTMARNALEKVLSGVTCFQEVEREVSFKI